MTLFPLLAASFIMKVAQILFTICAVVLVLTILIQKGKGGGLSGAFGGGVASGILGTKTKEPMTWITIVLVCLFLTLAVLMGKFLRPSVSEFGEGQTQRPLVEQERPADTPRPIAPTTTDANDDTGQGL